MSITNKAWLNLLSRLEERPVASLQLKELAERHQHHCRELWESFTGQRQRKGLYFDDKTWALAYLLSFHLSNSQRMTALLQRMQQRIDLFPHDRVWTITDFGAGTGAALFAVLDAMRNPRAQVGAIHLTEPSESVKRAVQDELEQGLGKLRGPDPRRKNASLLLFSYVLNELSPKDFTSVEQRLHDTATGEPTVVLVLDAADEVHARQMMSFRDRMTAAGWIALYPCPHSKACPMLASHNWCYSEWGYTLPPDQQIIDQVLRHPREILAASAYAFANPAFMAQQEVKKRAKKVFVGAPIDRSDSTQCLPIYCNHRGALDKRGKLARARCKYKRGDISQ